MHMRLSHEERRGASEGARVVSGVQSGCGREVPEVPEVPERQDEQKEYANTVPVRSAPDLPLCATRPRQPPKANNLPPPPFLRKPVFASCCNPNQRPQSLAYIISITQHKEKDFPLLFDTVCIRRPCRARLAGASDINNPPPPPQTHLCPGETKHPHLVSVSVLSACVSTRVLPP
jgi:hypothetical protein